MEVNLLNNNKHDIICQAIFNLDANAQFTLVDNDINNIIWETSPINKSDIEDELSNAETTLENKQTEQADLKASAKAKLIAGEPLTEEEADTIVL